MSGIACTQPGGVGVVTDGSATDGTGTILLGAAADLSFVGTTTTWTWSIYSRPASSTNASLYTGLPNPPFNTAQPGFLADVAGVYVIRFVSSAAVTYSLTLNAYRATTNVPPQSFNIEAYGASTSATSETNTAALVAAVTAADAAGGGVVYIPVGDYNVTVPSAHGSTAFHLANISNVTIRGAGRYLSRLVDGGVKASAAELYPTEQGDPQGTAAFLTFNDPTNVHISELGFVGKGVFQAADIGQTAVDKKAIYFKHVTTGTNDCSVCDCYFELIEGEVIFADGAVNRSHNDRNHFRRCLSNQVNQASAPYGTYKSDNCSADDNVFESPGASIYQGGGHNWSLCRNKVSMLPADAGLFTSTLVLVVNSLNFKFDDNQIDGIVHSGGTPIVHIGYQGDTDGCVGTSLRRNVFSNCQILGQATDPSSAILVIDSSYGPQSYSVEENTFLACSEQNHSVYPNVVGIRLMGTFRQDGVIGRNVFQANGATNPLNIGVMINSGVVTTGVISLQPNTFDSSITTPYNLAVQPAQLGPQIIWGPRP